MAKIDAIDTFVFPGLHYQMRVANCTADNLGNLDAELGRTVRLVFSLSKRSFAKYIAALRTENDSATQNSAI